MQADAEHEEDDAHLGELARQLAVGDQTEGERAGEDAGDQIPDEGRQPQPVRGEPEDEGEDEGGGDSRDQCRLMRHCSPRLTFSGHKRGAALRQARKTGNLRKVSA
jgi:hypothetical protein